MFPHSLPAKRPGDRRPAALILPSVGLWLVLAAIATVAGIVRHLWLVPLIGELRGHQVGTLIVAAAFVVVIAVFIGRVRLSPGEANELRRSQTRAG